MTQKQRIMLHLRTQEWVCVSSLPLDLAYTARNRISELRREGVEIESSPCRTHQHHAGVSRYRLAQAGQQAMAI
jgi:biotin operon repressor